MSTKKRKKISGFCQSNGHIHFAVQTMQLLYLLTLSQYLLSSLYLPDYLLMVPEGLTGKHFQSFCQYIRQLNALITE